MAFFEFPHTRTYDSDLGWLIKRVNEQQDQMDAQEIYMNELKAWMDENEPRIEHIEELYTLFEEGQLPPAVVEALNNWLTQYGVLNAANEYTDEKTATLAAALASEVTTRSTENAAMQAQINELIAPTGEAPNPAEVVDARVGYDGTTYTSLGEAVRTQAENNHVYTTNVKNIVDQLALNMAFEKRIPYSSESGKYWDVSGSVAVKGSLSGWYAVNPVAVTPGDIMKVTNRQGASHRTRIWAIVDSAYNILAKAEDYFTTSTHIYNEVFYVPDGAAYLLITTSADIADQFGIRKLLTTYTVIEKNIPFVSEKSWYWNVETGKAVKTYFGGSSYRAGSVIPVKEGEYYIITGRQGGTHRTRIWMACDDALNIIAQADDFYSSAEHTLYVTIPAGATRLMVSSFGSDDQVPYATIYKVIPSYDKNTYNWLAGKNVAIIGDSISTNGNSGDWANTPEITIQSADIGVPLSAYLTYYDVQAGLSLGGHTFTSAEIGTEVTFTPVSADQGKKIGLPDNYNPNARITWWERAAQHFGFNPINVSWSGASITSHEGSAPEFATSYAWHDAQIRKCGIRVPGSMNRVAPDVIILFRGVNDFSHTPYARLTDGYFDSLSWEYPNNDTVNGNYGFYEGIAMTVKKLRAAYPNAQIVLCTLNAFKRVNYAHFPVNNGYNTLPEYNDAIRRAADFFGCITLDIDRDGITFENLYTGGFVTDSATTPTHPNDVGQYVIGAKAIADLTAKYNTMV